MNLLDLAVVIRAEDNASAAIQRASGNATSSFGSVAKGAAVFTAVQQVASAAFSAIAGSIDGAVARVDTLNAFPKIMQNLGVDSDSASAAIKKLSSGIDGLPTTLDAAANGVTRLVSKNSDVDKSTDYFLALNDAIVAGGASSDIQSSAVEQLTQAYSKGRMDMEEWRSLQMAMPAQLNQVASAMGMTTDALGEGLRNGTVSMDDFMDTLVKLDSEGVDGLASFHDQAQDATGGIGTSFANMKTAIVKNLANVIDALNGEQGNISGFFNGMKDAINGLGSFISANIAPITAGIAAIGGAFAALQVGSAVSGLAKGFGDLTLKISKVGGVIPALTSAFPLLANPVGIAVVAIAALIAAFAALYATSEDFRNAVQPGIDAVKGAFEEFAGVVGPKIQELAAVAIPLLQEAFAAALPFIEMAWNNLVLIVTTALDIITGAIEFWSALISGDFGSAFDILVSLFTEVWTNIGTIVSNALMMLVEIIGSLLLAIGEAVGTWLVGLMQGFLDFCAQFIAGCVAFFGQIIADVAAFILGIITSIGQFLANIIASAAAFFASVISGIAGFISSAVASISAFVVNVINFFANLWSNVTNIVSLLWNSVKSAFSGGVSSVKSFVSGMVSAVVGFFGNLASDVSGKVSGLVTGVVDYFTGLKTKVETKASEIWSSVTGKFSAGVTNAVEAVSGLPGRITGIFSGVGDWLVSSGQSLIDGFVNGITGAIDWAASTVEGCLSRIRGMFPFSPAKTGPFSGRGWVLYSGQAIAEALGEGFSDKMATVTAAARIQMEGLRSEIDAKQAGIGIGYTVSAVSSENGAVGENSVIGLDASERYDVLVYAIRDAVGPMLKDGFNVNVDKREFGRMVRAYG